jgi:hypothetical protein
MELKSWQTTSAIMLEVIDTGLSAIYSSAKITKAGRVESMYRGCFFQKPKRTRMYPLASVDIFSQPPTSLNLTPCSSVLVHVSPHLVHSALSLSMLFALTLRSSDLLARSQNFVLAILVGTIRRRRERVLAMFYKMRQGTRRDLSQC